MLVCLECRGISYVNFVSNHCENVRADALVAKLKLSNSQQIQEMSTHLCAVKLSQKATSPSGLIVITQVWAAPLALVPTQTYALSPNPCSRLHNRTAWSSQSLM